MIARPFRHEAENRRLTFETFADPALSQSLVTDAKRLQQVLKNLLSNAFKFTEQGQVRLSVLKAESGWTADHPILSKSESVVAFEVADTGIGIPAEKQRIIFEAFQQADAGTSRKYGGTGLGLAISRELASLLGGEIQLRSAPGKGSTFTIYLPQTYVGPSSSPMVERSAPSQASLSAASISEHPVEKIPDDRDNLQPDDAILLIVEDDPHYARVLRDLSRDKGFKVLESLVARKITQHSRIMWIVFDNQQDCIVRLQIVAVVRNLFDRMFRDAGGGQGRLRWGRSLHHGRAGRSYVGLRQVNGESTSLARSPAQLHFAAHQPAHLPTHS